MATKIDQRPLVALIGGPDVDARIPLVEELKGRFRFVVHGSDPLKANRFAQRGIAFRAYPLSRRVAPIADLRTVMALRASFQSERPDVVHAFDTKPCVFAALAARAAGVPVVTSTITGLGSLYSSNSAKTRIVRMVYERMQRMACRRSDLTVFQNHDDERQLLASGIAQRGKTMVVLGSGVDTNAFDPQSFTKADRNRVRTELGIAEDAIVVTMVSRMTRTKGALEFAAIARECSQQDARTRFLAVGGEDRDSIDCLTREELASLRAATTWTGARDDVAAILAASDVFVLPSVCREGIPRSLLEAAAMGLPLVTTDSPGCNEACSNGHNGLVAKIGDLPSLTHAVSLLIGDPELRARYGAASRKLARERFDLRVIADQLASAWTRLLDAARSRHSAATATKPASNILSR